MSADTERGPRQGPDVRLLPAFAAAWAAAWWATGCGSAPSGPRLVVAGALACQLLALVLVIRARGVTATASLALALAVTGIVLAATVAACVQRYRPPLPGWAAERAVVDVRARVVADPRPVTGGQPGSARFALRVTAERATGRGRTARLGAPLLVLGDASWGGLSAGQSVTAVGRLRAAGPGEDVVALLAAQGPPRAVTAGWWPWRLADRLRAGLRDACQGLPADAGGLLPSLVVGDTSRLPERLRTDLKAAGLTHVTAVSGANVAIAAGAALWLAAAVGAGRRVRVLLTAAVLVGFVIVARPEPSVLRAAAMGGVALVGLVTARRSRGVPVLAAAGIALLVGDPWLSRNAGFALSCAATAGLLLLAPVWTSTWRGRLPGSLAAGLAVPAAAQAACGPVLVLLQPSVSLVSIPANLLAEPAVAPATVLGLVAALVAPVCPPLAHAIAWCAGLATGWIAAVAHGAAGAPLAQVPWPAGVGGAMLLAGLTAGLVLLTTGGARRRSRRERPAGARAAGGGPARAVAGLLTVVVAIGVGWWAGPRVLPGAHGDRPPPGWALAQCDVGQGAAMVARSGEDRGVLVDTGPAPGPVDGCLRRLGVRHLDLVLLTHFHADHVGGLAGATHGRDVGDVLVSPLAEPAENAAAVREVLAAAHRPARAGLSGMSGRTADPGPGAVHGWSVGWRLLAPDEVPAAPVPGSPAGSDDGTEVNESSLVYVVDVHGPPGTLRVVGLGDLETEGQQRLLAAITAGRAGLGGPVDVVEVAHHGSARQVPGLYAALAVRVALIGVGAGNDYGHPAPSALAMLRRSGATVLRTDVAGDVVLTPAPDGALDVATSR